VSLPLLEVLARSAVAVEQRAVYTILGGINDPRADRILSDALQRLAAGTVPRAAQAELLDVASARPNPEVVGRLKEIESNWQSRGDRLAPFRSALEGGSVIEGRRLFERHSAVACLKCHEPGQATTQSAPELTGIGERQTREQILESVIFPNAKIEAGFERVMLTLAGRAPEQGIVLNENASQLELRRDDGSVVSIAKKDVMGRVPLPSAMPEDVAQVLSRKQLRDLVAYLAELKAISSTREPW
jgi:quinoprotein glucose dehydrogenase